MASKYQTPSTNDLEISTFCKEHKKQFKIYCKKHDCPCCSRCVVYDHQTCQDLILLKDMVKNVKNSYGFHDIQQTITDLVDTIQIIKTDRQANLSKLKEERICIEKEIERARITINAQLDKLQEVVMKELNEAESKESKMIGQLLDLIEKNENEIRGYQENIIKIQQHASDLQTFLAMKHMERDVDEKDKYFTSLLTSKKLIRVSLSCKINDTLQNICKKIRKFGEVIISSTSCELQIVRKKEKQAQIVISPAPSKSIDNISFILQSTFNTMADDIRGCTFLPDGRMVFSWYEKNRVRVASLSEEYGINIYPSDVFDITYIHDHTIAVSGGYDPYINIIDVESTKVKATIPVGSANDGIVSRNNTLIYCAAGRGLRMINLTDKSVNTIVTNKMSCFAYVTTFGDKIYYTNKDTHTVTCCDLNGTTQWEFKDESVLRYPQGISVDNACNVYVACVTSHNVVVISPDGKQHRQLLSVKNGLSLPQALHYDRSTNQLLVANRTGKVFLYSLK